MAMEMLMEWYDFSIKKTLQLNFLDGMKRTCPSGSVPKSKRACSGPVTDLKKQILQGLKHLSRKVSVLQNFQFVV
jgi:hypothetical protein